MSIATWRTVCNWSYPRSWNIEYAQRDFDAKFVFVSVSFSNNNAFEVNILLCISDYPEKIFIWKPFLLWNFNICIFIAIAGDETSILVAVHFSMHRIYQSCDIGLALGRGNVDVSQLRHLFTDVCVTLVTYRHDVKCGSSVSWHFYCNRQDLR